MDILVINSGSSSVKFKFHDMLNHACIASGLIEEIGSTHASGSINCANGRSIKVENEQISNHETAIAIAIDLLKQSGVIKDLTQVGGIGHRIVQGADYFDAPALIDEDVMAKIAELAPLAPLHNPANLAGIKSCLKIAPKIPNVAVFDTIFHQSIPPYAYMYALPYEFYEKYKVRRYGAHGTSYRFVAEEAARFMGKDSSNLKLVIAHLGNGASITAVKNGESQDTSMGFTPLEGLVMGTRSGDVDAGIYPFLASNAGMSVEEVSDLLNKKSGLLGISELSNDCRIVEEAAAEGHESAKLAIAVTTYRLAKYIAAMAVAAGGIDALVFTGGIGENSDTVRAQTVAHLAFLGLKLDEQANVDVRFGKEGIISPKGQTPAVVVVPTNEELMIAHDTAALSGL